MASTNRYEAAPSEPAVSPAGAREVSVSAAARELGVSPETVRRWIKTGRLRATRAIRPQGTVWRVTLPATTPRGVPPVTRHAEASPSEPEHATPGGAWDASPALVAPGDAAVLVASIARLIAELAETRAISDRRADQLVGLTETIAGLRDAHGRLAVELEATAAEAMMAKLREGRLADELAELRATLARYTEILVRRAGASVSDAPVVERASWGRHWRWIAVLIVSLAAAAVIVLSLLAWGF